LCYIISRDLLALRATFILKLPQERRFYFNPPNPPLKKRQTTLHEGRVEGRYAPAGQRSAPTSWF